MKNKMTTAARLAAAFVAGLVTATLLSGVMAAGAKTQEAVLQGQQVNVQRVISPTVTDIDIARSTHC